MSEKIIFEAKGTTAMVASKLTPSGGGQAAKTPVEIKTRESNPVMRK